MCLRIVLDKEPHYEGKGWKIFKRNYKDELFPTIFTSGGRLPSGKWLNERKYRPKYCSKSGKILPDFGSSYTMGWHIYLQKPSRNSIMNNEVCLEVKYRYAYCMGKQGGRYVIVAGEIFISRKKK